MSDNKAMNGWRAADGRGVVDAPAIEGDIHKGCRAFDLLGVGQDAVRHRHVAQRPLEE